MNPVDALSFAATALPARSQVKAFILDALTTHERGESYTHWMTHLSLRGHYYPSTHVVPNAGIVTAALYWGNGHWDRIIEIIAEAGFDPIHNALVAGALAKTFCRL